MKKAFLFIALLMIAKVGFCDEPTTVVPEVQASNEVKATLESCLATAVGPEIIACHKQYDNDGAEVAEAALLEAKSTQ